MKFRVIKQGMTVLFLTTEEIFHHENLKILKL